MSARFIPTVERESIDLMCVPSVYFVQFIKLSFFLHIRDRNVASTSPLQLLSTAKPRTDFSIPTHSMEQGTPLRRRIPLARGVRTRAHQHHLPLDRCLSLSDIRPSTGTPDVAPQPIPPHPQVLHVLSVYALAGHFESHGAGVLLLLYAG